MAKSKKQVYRSSKTTKRRQVGDRGRDHRRRSPRVAAKSSTSYHVSTSESEYEEDERYDSNKENPEQSDYSSDEEQEVRKVANNVRKMKSRQAEPDTDSDDDEPVEPPPKNVTNRSGKPQAKAKSKRGTSKSQRNHHDDSPPRQSVSATMGRSKEDRREAVATSMSNLPASISAVAVQRSPITKPSYDELKELVALLKEQAKGMTTAHAANILMVKENQDLKARLSLAAPAPNADDPLSEAMCAQVKIAVKKLFRTDKFIHTDKQSMAYGLKVINLMGMPEMLLEDGDSEERTQAVHAARAYFLKKYAPVWTSALNENRNYVQVRCFKGGGTPVEPCFL
jgi:hypothetical protein